MLFQDKLIDFVRFVIAEIFFKHVFKFTENLFYNNFYPWDFTFHDVNNVTATTRGSNTMMDAVFIFMKNHC